MAKHYPLILDGTTLKELPTGDGLSLLDNEKLTIGADSDLRIYHDGSHSYIDEQGTGDLQIRGNNLALRNASGEAYVRCTSDDWVKLYHDDAEKLATTSTGVSVTGNVTVSGTVDGRDVATDGTKLDGIESGATADQTASEILTAIKTVDGSGSGLDADTLDGVESTSFLRSDAGDVKTSGNLQFNDDIQAQFGTDADLKIYHNGSHSYIDDTGTGRLYIRGGSDLTIGKYTGETHIYCVSDAEVQLFHNDVKKFQTVSTGVSITGRAFGTQTTDNDGSFNLQESNHFVCTPSANFTLTFTNHTAGQAGTIILINSGGYTVSAASTTKVMGADLLTTITTAGTYVLGYVSDGTNTRIYNSGAQQ